MATSPSKDKDREPQAEGNIYASKTELLEWVNGLLQLQLSRYAELLQHSTCASRRKHAAGSVITICKAKLHILLFRLAVHMPCRLEQFASGAVFCQLLDAYFKDAIPMGKVGCRACCQCSAVLQVRHDNAAAATA